MEEIEDLIMTKLDEDYPKYKRALSFYQECLTDVEMEKLDESQFITYPAWLNETIAE